MASSTPEASSARHASASSLGPNGSEPHAGDASTAKAAVARTPQHSAVQRFVPRVCKARIPHPPLSPAPQNSSDGSSSPCRSSSCSNRGEGLVAAEGPFVGSVKVVKRALVALVSVYLVAALVGRAREASGAITCGCAPECWCKRPGLSLFRWVFPVGHRGESKGISSL